MPSDKNFYWSFAYNAIINDFITQPDALEDCLNYYESGEGAKLLEDVQHWVERNHISKVYLIGNTFNYFASFVAKFCFMQTKNCLPFSCESFELTEFYDYVLPQEQPKDALYIFVSKSGNSALVRESIHQLNLIHVNQNCIWMVTNNEKAKPIKNGEVGRIFPIRVNSEIVLGTRSYQNTVLVLFLIAKILSHMEVPQSEINQMVKNLIINMRKFASQWEPTVNKIIDSLGKDFQYIYIIARDPISLSCANLGALSAKTFTRIFTEGISLGLFFHGPFQIFEQKRKNTEVKCIVLVGDNTSQESDRTLERLIQLINQRAGKVIILSNDPALVSSLPESPRILLVPFNSVRTEFSSIFEMFILQFVLVRIAVERGMIPETREEK